jgi:hypothetical protein
MREGVVHEVQRLSRREAVTPSPAGDAITALALRLFDRRFGPGSGLDSAAVCGDAVRRAEAAAERLRRGEVRGRGAATRVRRVRGPPPYRRAAA